MSALLRLLSFLLRSSRAFHLSRVAIVLLVATGMLAGVASTGLIAVINHVLSGEAGTWPFAAGWAFAALCALLPVSRFLSERFLVRLSQDLTYSLQIRLCRQILRTPLRKLEELGPARLLAALTDDVRTITNALANLPTLFLHVTVVLSCIGYMGWLSWRLLGVVLGVLAFGVLTYRFPLAGAVGRFREARRDWDVLVDRFRGVVEGTKELKLHQDRRDAFFSRSLEPVARSRRDHYVAGGTLYALAQSWGQVLFFLLIGFLLFLSPLRDAAGSTVLVGYTLAILYMLTPLDVLLGALPNLGRAVAACEAVERLGIELDGAGWEGVVEASEPAAPGGPAPSWNRLRFAGVTHTYFRGDIDDTFTLGPIDLTLEPGELVFLIGGNGSGKTTLGKLLVGLYEPEEGQVLLDGRPVTEDLDGYWRLFSAVFSDFFLFDMLLGLGEGGLDERAAGYLRRLHLEHKVEVTDGTLSTLSLSQGQRKRLALLTAYLEDREIYLFDEWAADQDPEFKRVFYHQILPELVRRGKTVVGISHDDQYYEAADRIVKLESGRLVFDGTAEAYGAWLSERVGGVVVAGEP